MKTQIKLLLCHITVFLLFGCAGTKFVRMADDSLKLGVTTQQDILTKMGDPYRKGMITKNQKQFNTLSYAYASTGGEAVYKGITASRSQAFLFYDNILVGHEFSSTEKEGHTDFENKSAQLTENTSTHKDVTNLMGTPHGRYTYPLAVNESGESLIYIYSQTKGSAFNLKFYNKMLVFEINKDGEVTKIDYTESGDK